MIAYMKELGMSLSEIAEVFQKEDLTLIEDILSKKNEQIHEQIRQLRARHDAVERAIISIERYRKSPATGTMSLEYIDRRYIWGIPCSDNFYNRSIPTTSALRLQKTIFYMIVLLQTKFLFSLHVTSITHINRCKL